MFLLLHHQNDSFNMKRSQKWQIYNVNVKVIKQSLIRSIYLHIWMKVISFSKLSYLLMTPASYNDDGGIWSKTNCSWYFPIYVRTTNCAGIDQFCHFWIFNVITQKHKLHSQPTLKMESSPIIDSYFQIMKTGKRKSKIHFTNLKFEIKPETYELEACVILR